MGWWDQDGGYGWGGMGGGWLVGLLVGAVLLLGLVAVVVVAVRTARQRSAPPPAGDAVPAHSRARAVLDERYARGDIDDEEYRRRLEVLAGPGV